MVANWVGKVPADLDAIVVGVSQSGGTPLVVATRSPDGVSRVLGVIHLKDVVKEGLRERFAELRAMGIRTVIWTGGLEAPAVECADEVIDLPFDDPAALADFCARVTVSTIEFENIPCETLEKVARCTGLHPSPYAICICQNREREKNFLREHSIPHTG